MKFIRKALLPAVIAAGFLGFLGAVGASAEVVYDADGVVNTEAGPGDVCRIDGPTLISEGETADYTAHIENQLDFSTLIAVLEEEFGAESPEGVELLSILGVLVDGVTTDVSVDDSVGDSDITSYDSDGNGVTEDIPATDHLNAIETFSGENICGLTDEEALNEAEAALLAEVLDDIEQCIDTDTCENDWTESGGGGVADVTTPLDVGIDPEDIAIFITGRLIAGDDCGDLHDEVEDYLSRNGVSPGIAEDIANDIDDDGDGLCVDNAWDVLATIFLFLIDDREIMVDVTCNQPGNFDLSFAPEWSLVIQTPGGLEELSLEDIGLTVGAALSIDVRCGSDVDHATIIALPATVEINPSIANVAHSLVWVTLFDEDDDNALAGDEVMFTTDRCAVEASTVATEDEFEAAETLFRANNPLNPATALAVEGSVYATTGPDGASRQQEEVNSFVVTGSASTDFAERTVAAVILHCDPIHAPGVTPGPAVVTAYIEVGDDDEDEGDQDEDLSNNDDIVLKTTVTVVGPPAANGVTVTAAPASLACGEKATITVDVKDAIGQPVSDHTFVEAVTNAGGVLAGTGAVAGQAGLVSPVSSTVAETFGGKATFYLLTSTAHVGKYEVVVTTGGGGGVAGQLSNGGVTTNLLGGLFTTAPISVQVTVECTVPAAAPVVVVQESNPPTGTGPSTGQGIRPPSTGDAGLVSTESNTMVAGAALAVVASLVVAGFAVKLVREED